MTYHTLCFYCHKSLKLREAIIVKEALSKTILTKMHPGCWLELTKNIAQSKLEYDETRELMQDARNQVQTSPSS